MRKIMLSALIFGSLCSSSVKAAPKDRLYAVKLYKHLTEQDLQLSDPRLDSMELFITAGQYVDAAKVATKDPRFLQTKVRSLASRLVTRSLVTGDSPPSSFDDFQALFIGTTRDNLDARLMLNGDYRYQARPELGLPEPSLANNDHYLAIDKNSVDLEKDLILVQPQTEGFPDAAGLLTTRAWATSFLDGGTNRRPTQFAVSQFLCKDMQAWSDPHVSDERVRRDVSRANVADYQACKSCHAPLDALSGAFARFDFKNGQLVWLGQTQVAKKMNSGADTYPNGFITSDDSWINLSTTGHSADFGWRGDTSGSGVHDFGTMLGNAAAFSRCMTQRVFAEVCNRQPGDDDFGVIKDLASSFEKNGYGMRDLFAMVAAKDNCISHK